MKKLLALVLALVMTLSLCVTSNAAFTDAKDVNADYEEAVAVLSGMGVFKGYEDGSFGYTKGITRAEVAAIVYRLYTGDVKDKQAGLYAGYGKFDDMAGAQWAAGYVGFCANAGFIKGYGDGKFGPSDPVTGYQALAMILRAVGYGKNGEFEGSDWELHVAQVAQQVGALKNVKAVSLKAAATRELVAELLFQVASDVDTVTYTPAFGYVTADIAKDVKAETLGWTNFRLTKDTKGNDDDWGRPAYIWYGEYSNKDAKYAEEYNAYDKSSKDVKYATIKDTPVASYTEAVTECQIADDLGLSKNKTVEQIYKNGKEAKNVIGNNNVIEPLATTSKVGAQGELVEIYDVTDDENSTVYRFVIVDTYLAQVTKVSELKYDKAGHKSADAKIEMDVYGANVETLTLTDDEENFDFEEDDYVLVNLKDATHGEILGLADSFDGALTKTSSSGNAVKTVVIDGTSYELAAKYDLDAGVKGKACTWFVDQYGNVIGSKVIKNVYSYAVIKDIQWINPTSAKGYAQATLVYMDGSEELVTVDKIDNAALKYANINAANYGNKKVSTVLQDNYDEFCGDDLFQVYETEDGTVEMAKVGLAKNDWTFPVGNTHNQLTAATVKKGVSAITGTGTPAEIYTNSDTVYLVQVLSSKDKDENDVKVVGANTTYEVVSGYNNIGTYTGTATVDYVLNSKGTYAEYVFITGVADESTSDDLFYVTSETDSVAVYYTSKGKFDYAEVEGYLNGEKETVKLDKDGFDDIYGSYALTDYEYMIDAENVMFSVHFVDGKLHSATAIYEGNDEAALTLSSGNPYKDCYVDYFSGDVTYTADVLKVGNVYYNVTNSTVVYGDALSATMKNQDFYVIHKANKTDAVAVYHADAPTWRDIDVTLSATVNGTAAVSEPVNANVGATVVLTATVTGAEDVQRVDYQWYSSANDVQYVAINGATAKTYTVPTDEAGTVYYGCEVTAYDDEKSYKVDYDDDTLTVTVVAVPLHTCNTLASDEAFVDLETAPVTVNVTGFETYKVSDLLADVYVKEGNTAVACEKATVVVKDNHGVLADTVDLKAFVGQDDLKIVVTAEDTTATAKTYVLKITEDVVKYSIAYNGCTGVVDEAAAGDTVAVTKGSVPFGYTVMFAVSSGSTTTYYYAQNNDTAVKDLTVMVVMPAGNTSISAVFTESDPVTSVTVNDLNGAERSTLVEGTVFKGKMTPADSTAFGIPDASKDKYVGWKLANGTGTNQASLTITQVGGWTATANITTATNTITLGTAGGEVFTTNDTELENGQYNWMLAIGEKLYTGTFWIKDEIVSFTAPN